LQLAACGVRLVALWFHSLDFNGTRMTRM